MEWSKIKNIIILMLLALNLILLIMVGMREYETSGLQEAARAEAMAVLEKNGIAVAADLPPDRSLRLLQIDWERSEAQETAEAEALLGTGVHRQADPGGVRVRYSGDKGEAEFAGNGGFRLSLVEGAYPVTMENAMSQGVDCLALLGFDAELVGTEQTDCGYTLTYWQRWEGVPVFTCSATLTYENDFLRRIEGKRLQGSITAAGIEKQLTVPTALIRFLAGMSEGGNVSSKIVKITAGYEATGATRPYRLTPVWDIVTDTWEYYLDGFTGALTRVEHTGAIAQAP